MDFRNFRNKDEQKVREFLRENIIQILISISVQLHITLSFPCELEEIALSFPEDLPISETVQNISEILANPEPLQNHLEVLQKYYEKLIEFERTCHKN